MDATAIVERFQRDKNLSEFPRRGITSLPNPGAVSLSHAGGIFLSFGKICHELNEVLSRPEGISMDGAEAGVSSGPERTLRVREDPDTPRRPRQARN